MSDDRRRSPARAKRARKESPSLGARLRELRDGTGESLRAIEAKSDLNSGYLSQLEQGKVTQPTPSVLHKVALGYGVPLSVVMRWAGYIEDGVELSPTQARALSYLGDNPTEEEVEALKAVLDVLRSKSRVSFSGASFDLAIARGEQLDIRERAVRALREIDGVERFPTPLDDVTEVADLVLAGELTLTSEDRRNLFRVFGDVANYVWQKLQGMIDFRSREVWLNPELHEMRRRFVQAHELGHDLLDWQRETFACLDDHQRLRPDVRLRFEREANQFAIELLAQGDGLREEFDDSRPSLRSVEMLSGKYGLSMVAAARRIGEESRQECAVAIAFRRGTGMPFGPPHLYRSASFVKRFGWDAASRPSQIIYRGLTSHAINEAEPVLVRDRAGDPVLFRIASLNLPRSVIALFAPDEARRLRLRMPAAG
jgi:transcriptional regulator with XRE-family HTH domain